MSKTTYGLSNQSSVTLPLPFIVKAIRREFVMTPIMLRNSKIYCQIPEQMLVCFTEN